MTEETRYRKQLYLSKKKEVPGAREEVVDLMVQLGYDERDRSAVRLALEEALLNGIEHGNKCDENKKVTLEYSLDQEKVEINVTDEGSGFDPGCVGDCTAEENLNRPRGRGILLMRSYMDVMEYSPKGNALRLVKFKGTSKDSAEKTR